MYTIDPHDLANYLADAELKKTCSQVAEELYKTRGNDFCTGLVLHLVMYLTGHYDE